MDTVALWLIIVGGFAFALFWQYRKQQIKAAADRLSELRRAEVERLALKAQNACDRLPDMKTATGQSNQAKTFPGDHSIWTPADYSKPFCLQYGASAQPVGPFGCPIAT